jgi:putative ABC transport system ATP-binding protein
VLTRGGMASAHDHPTPWSRLWSLVRAERPLVRTLLALSLAVGVLQLGTPVAVQALVDAVAFGGLVQPLVILALVLLGCLSLVATFRALQTYVAELLQQRIFARVVAALGRRLPRVRLDQLDHQHAPELVNRFFDVVTVQKAGAQLLSDGFTIILTTLAGLLLLAFYHPVLLALDLLLVAGIAVVAFGLGRGAVRTSVEESKAKYRAGAWLEELARHPVAFRGNGGPQFAVAEADRLAEEYSAARARHFRVLFRQVIGALALQAGASTVLLALGGYLVIAGTLTLGQLVAAELVVALVVGSVTKLGKSLESLYDLLAAIDKLGHLLDLPVEDAEGEAFAVSGPAAFELRSASLEIGGRQVLPPTSVAIAAGQRAAVVGPPGSGKSALLDLLYGLRTATSGEVVLDGQDERDLAPDELRRRVALVRAPEVVEGTVLDNVVFGRTEVDREQVRGALEAVGLSAALRELPAGIEARLATGGAPLSETQSRLVVLARALVGRPGLLLLDRTLDDLTAREVWPFLSSLNADPQAPTLLVATSRAEVAALFDHRITLGHEERVERAA